MEKRNPVGADTIPIVPDEAIATPDRHREPRLLPTDAATPRPIDGRAR